MRLMGTSDDKLMDKTFMATLLKYLIYIIADNYGLHIYVLHYHIKHKEYNMCGTMNYSIGKQTT